MKIYYGKSFLKIEIKSLKKMTLIGTTDRRENL